MKLRIGRLAAADVDAIFGYGLLNFGPDQAIAYLDQIEAKYRLLLDHPRSGRADPALGTGVRSLSCRSHRIYYQVDGETILIRRVRHKASDPRWWLG